ncbi:MAG: D-galactarolactone cycloisomerase [Candidatus Moanabacter tarae]|uniref:D-galactarolactone cycloisomerase n=1 Tax=Candidatus Moanibacter tarae TaxID=2200854 RepID=A0A2Z4AKQ6_9BACT|nr:MAG: D-galactarolactone cycloisomerase [Candidatus Moanabacter tarae]|tara:strand:- start:9781 stop:11019 length:1239 start_codon:yes stop_codon:yes gene_type:complete
MNNTSQLIESLGREHLSISRIKVTPISYQPEDGSFIHECGPVVLTKRDEAVVQIWTEEGLEGIGPGSLSYSEQNFDSLIGQNPFDLLEANLPQGLNVACWDLVGRAKNRPVYQLLALDQHSNPRVHVYSSGGVMWTYYDRGDGKMYGVDALIEEALNYKELGFDTFKWRPGTDWEEAGVNPKKLGEICRQLRQAVGPDFKLGLEKKGYDSWTLEECLQIAPIISDLGFYFFEQPMGDAGPEQFDDYLKIKALMPGVMLWGGESFRTFDEAEPWMREGIYDAVQSDCLHLGLTQNWRIAQLGRETDTKIVPHNWSTSLGTMCNAHLVAGTGGHMLEFFMYPSGFRYGLFKEPYRPDKGVITLTDAPGFGVELIDDFADKFPYRSGPNTIPNPRIPEAWDRAQTRQRAVAGRYR